MNSKLKKALVFLLFTTLIIETILILARLGTNTKHSIRYINAYHDFEKQELFYRTKFKRNVQREEQSTSVSKSKYTVALSTDILRSTKYNRKSYVIATHITNTRHNDRVAEHVNDVSGKSIVTGKVNVYQYDDICVELDTKNMLWNANFPLRPVNVSMKNSLEEKEMLMVAITRRITGFITPTYTGYYEFEILSRSGFEFILIENYEKHKGRDTLDHFLLRFGLYKEEIIRDDSKYGPMELYKKRTNKSVLLTKGSKYLFDFTHAIHVYGRFEIKWRNHMDKTFRHIPPDVLSPFEPTSNLSPVLPKIKYLQKSRKTKLLEGNKKNQFYKRIQIDDQLPIDECEYKPSYIPNKVIDGYGVGYVKIDLLYPKDELIENHIPGLRNLWLQNQTANNIVQKYLKLLKGNYTLNSVVHIEENEEDRKGKRYFIELDLINKADTKLYRSSGWVFVKKSGEWCRPKGYTWKQHEKIYLLTPVKNQKRWVQYLIERLNNVVKVTGERNIHLMMVDYNSTDAILEHVMKEALFPYTLIKQIGRFIKVRGLNLAVKMIKEKDALLFIFDLHLQIPLFIFDYIRKHTFKSKSTYCPVLLRAYCGQHPEHTELTKYSIWQEIGYGMISIFKSDWNAIGGMDEKNFTDKWGGEDWDFVERIIKKKIEVIHHRIPGYYHLHHSTAGTWDGTKRY